MEVLSLGYLSIVCLGKENCIMYAGKDMLVLQTPVLKDTTMTDVLVHLGWKEKVIFRMLTARAAWSWAGYGGRTRREGTCKGLLQHPKSCHIRPRQQRALCRQQRVARGLGKSEPSLRLLPAPCSACPSSHCLSAVLHLPTWQSLTVHYPRYDSPRSEGGRNPQILT